MQITRNGKTFSLTAGELFEAYLEQERQFDLAYVASSLESDGEYSGLSEDERASVFAEIATEMRRIADKECIHSFDALEKARKKFDVSAFA